MSDIISIEHVNKTYKGGFQALQDINLKINQGEIFALLGPNGAGKTTLISIICGIASLSSGRILVGGFDTVEDYRDSRSLIGLVPQELTTDAFESVWNTVSFSRGLFGKPAKPEFIEKILKDLSLWEKKDNRLMELSGGMKRRVMIAKALAHEPKVLFLDEPTAGVDVELRKDMWEQVRLLRNAGVTIILTTHYIEEAEEMADRVGVINQGKLLLVEDKNTLMKKLGNKQISIELEAPVDSLPSQFDNFKIQIDGNNLIYTYDPKNQHGGIAELLTLLNEEKISFVDIHTKESSLEEIFIELVNEA